MVWLGIAVGVGAAALLVAIALRGRGSATGRTADDVDPLVAMGVVLAGTGVALGATLGATMYGVMIVGSIQVAIGASRTRHRKP